MSTTAITPTRAEDFPEWYQQVVNAADLAENSEVRGCMVIKPWGYGIWENIQRQLDAEFKATGHQNAYFPLLIPLSYLEKEAEHVEGFATECAVVTHHRLEAVKEPDGKTKLMPAGELAEPFVIRPTRETIIGAAFARWVESYRDLPLLINQWANVMRWEMRPRLFLRTAEFLWQEGHTAHETAGGGHGGDQADARRLRGIPPRPPRHPGHPRREDRERALPRRAERRSPSRPWCRTARPSRPAPRTSSDRISAKAANIEFLGRDNQRQHAWTTSWGVSTRLIGTLIMAHADDDGLILPPRVAPTQIVILPITPEARDARGGARRLRGPRPDPAPRIRIRRAAPRPRRQARHSAAARKTGSGSRKACRSASRSARATSRSATSPSPAATARRRKRSSFRKEEFIRDAADILDEIQNDAARPRHRRCATRTRSGSTPRPSSGPSSRDDAAGRRSRSCTGPAAARTRSGSQKELKVTIRCIPHGDEYAEEGKCFLTGKPSARRVVFARSY